MAFQGLKLSLWDSYGLAAHKLAGAGSISEDSRGRWYLNVCVEAQTAPVSMPTAVDAVGIDLGLKEFLATSDGEAVEAQRFYRDLEPALALAQRAGKKARAKAIHAKIANRRKDFLHKLSTTLVRKHGAVFVGGVSASALTQTTMAKSVLDAGWSSFRTMLKYKCDDAGVWFREVDEKYSTQECSSCSERTGPKGQGELHVREWACSSCGTIHDRDVNAACNIKAAGLTWLETQFATANARSDATASAMNEGLVARAAMPGAGHGPLAGGILPYCLRAAAARASEGEEDVKIGQRVELAGQEFRVSSIQAA